MEQLIVLLGILGGFTPLLAATPSKPQATQIEARYQIADQGTALVSHNAPREFKAGVAPKTVSLRNVTAYSSTPEETDDTPFIAASGLRVYDGMIAANWLPFGTKVRFPDIFGNRVFTVYDRMHERNADKVDIWFATKNEAIKFGSRYTKVEVLP